MRYDFDDYLYIDMHIGNNLFDSADSTRMSLVQAWT